MPPQPTTELIAALSSGEHRSLMQTVAEGPGRTVRQPITSEAEPFCYSPLFQRVCRALIDPDGYNAGLRRLDDDLRKRGPNQFARFYIEELLGRSPTTPAEAQELVLFPSRRIAEILCSDEFMARHDIILQREFAHLSREFFFHVPKSGGTTVVEAFASDIRFCPVYFFPGYDNGGFADRLGYLRKTILRLSNPQTRSVLMVGHPSAKRILSHNLKRGWDNAFTVLRDPIDASLSVINYVLTQLQKHPTSPDVIRWRNILGIPHGPFSPDRTAVLALIPAIVERISPINPVSSQLGIEACLESLLETAAILDLKIVRLNQIDDYLCFRGIRKHQRMNISTRYVEWSDLDQGLRLALYDKYGDDIKFYDWVGRHMFPGHGPWFEL
jgi:hypothetical protein